MVRAMLLGNSNQRGIKLHERCINGSMLFMAGVAIRRARNQRSLPRSIEMEEGPLAGVFGIFYVRFHAGKRLGLVLSARN